METLMSNLLLPSKLRNRDIHERVIPTVYNLRNLIEKLEEAGGDERRLKQWEKRCFYSYGIDGFKTTFLQSNVEERIRLIREYMLSENPSKLGAHCIDIYLVALVAENYGPGKDNFFNYIHKNGITDKANSANAIWQVGRRDGIYLGLLNDDGTIKDWQFFAQWIKGKKI